MAREPRGVVLYVHGLQSHAGWLFETGPALARLGVSLYVLDRRGSGASEGERGDTPSAAAWIDDHLAAMQEVRSRHAGVPLLLLGQSFGGALAAAVAVDPRSIADGLVLCSPSLGQWRVRVGDDERRALRTDRSAGPPRPSSLKDEQYTSDPRYLAFLRDDALLVRSVTPRFTAAAIDLEELALGDARPALRVPSVLVLPREDAVIDLAAARAAYHTYAGGEGAVVELPATEHYLEFGRCRSTLWRLVAVLAETSCLGSRSAP